MPASPFKHEAISRKRIREFTRNRSKIASLSEGDEAISLLIHEGALLYYTLTVSLGPRLVADDGEDFIQEQS